MVTDGDRLLDGLDAHQREAVTTTAAPLAIIAAAGSGKTTVLSRRIAHRITTGSADARHVVALTFTREAGAQLRRRLQALDVREPIESGTFHSVALRLLRDRALAQGRTPPQVVNDRRRLLDEAIREARVRVTPSALAADIDWARARLTAPDDYESANRRARRRSVTPPSRYGELVDRYEHVKRRRGVVDFDDLLVRALAEVRDDPTFAEVVRWRFRHLFVDEAQDLNPLQHALLEAWRDGRPDLCLVGDPRQAIYGWNGADPATLVDVEDRYPGITVVRLTSNYRCTPQVVRAGAAALAAADAPDDTRSARVDGPPVRVAVFDDVEGEVTAVCDAVRAMRGVRPWRQVAVLARTNDQLVAIEAALARAGVPVSGATGRSPLERALAEAFGCRTRESLAGWVERTFGDDEVDLVRARVADEADRFLASSEPGGFRAWVEARSPFDDLKADGDEGSVALMTFHAAKGREWPVVFVTGVEEGLVPHASAQTPAQRAEEARLLYVALTRAGEELVVSAATARNGAATEPSAWLDGVRAAAAADAPVPPPERFAPRPHPPDPVEPYRRWRSEAARRARIPDGAICSDRVLRSLADDPPASVDELAERLGITRTAAEHLHRLPRPADR